MSLIVIAVIVTALAFDFTNGFHDTANAMAIVFAGLVGAILWNPLISRSAWRTSPGRRDRHNLPEVVASAGCHDHYFREIVPI
jgi:hypothetical protein